MRDRLIGILALLVIFIATPVAAQPEFRAFWVDAFHTGIQTQGDIDNLVATARASNCNAVVVQVRKRGDAYYVSSYEPQATPGFDALAYLIQKCHDETPRLEIHAWLCTLPIATSPPGDPKHPYNKYPEFLTKNNTGSTFDGSNYSFDPGNPGALDYITKVYLDVVSRYDVDGVHHDYVRFAGSAWGYNSASVARFNAAKGHTGAPATDDEEWKQWRRDQISALVRKIYANTIAIKPQVKVSGSTITWGDGPADDTAWLSSSAYSGVLQDWRSWMEEGILDINIPMNYDRQHQSDQALFYEHWIAFCKDHKYDRHYVAGPGIYLNQIQGSLQQIRMTRDLTTAGNAADGVCMYSYASTNDQNMDGATMNAGDAPNADFYNALVNSSTYDTDPPFALAAAVPDMPWKSAPTKGHMKGNITAGGIWADGAWVTVAGPENRAMTADGTGFFAFIDLLPGTYSVSATFGAATQVRASVLVETGLVANADFDFAPGSPPVISNVVVTNVTDSSFTVTWTTDQQTTSKVEYGTSRALGASTVEDTARLHNHSVTISGLAELTPYYFRVIANASLGTPVYSPIYCTVTAFRQRDTIVDNNDPGAVPLPDITPWTRSTSAGFYGADSRWAASKTDETASYKFTPNLPVAGNYEVYVWYVKGSNRTRQASYTTYYDGGNTTEIVNQRDTVGSGFEANVSPENVRITPVGGVPFAAGTDGYVLLSNKTGDATGPVVVADAVKFRFVVPEHNGPSKPDGLVISQIGTDRITLSWGPSTDDTGVGVYKIFRDGVLAGGSTGTSFIDEGLTPNRSYSYTVVACDVYNNASAASDAAVVCTLPGAPAVSDSGAYTASRTQFSAAWQAIDNGCGISGYSYAAGTTAGGTNLAGWTETASPYVTINVAEQPYGGKVYFSAKARNSAGEWSDAGDSDGIMVAHTAYSIAEAKALPRGEPVMLWDPTEVTAVFSGFCYAQERSRCAGIRIEGTQWARGDIQDFCGILSEVGGELCLTSPDVIIPAQLLAIHITAQPLLVTGRMLGGSDFPVGVPNAGQRAVKAWHWVKVGTAPAFRRFDPVAGLNNIGLLVRVAGKVSHVEQDSLYLDDGSSYDDTQAPTYPGIKVLLPAGVSAPPVGTSASITGISSCHESAGDLYRLLRVRDAADIRAF